MRVAHLNYPSCEHLKTVSKETLLSHICEIPSIWGGKQNTPCSGFAKGPRFLNIVMTFTLTPLFHYNSITEPCARFLLSLLQNLSIDFPSHFITSVLNVYWDTTTRDKFIFPLVITRILCHFSIPILESPYFTFIGAISVGSVRRSKAQLRLKRPQAKMDASTSFAAPPSFSAPSTSAPSLAVDVTLKAIMAQLQCMNACLDSLTNEMC